MSDATVGDLGSWHDDEEPDALAELAEAAKRQRLGPPTLALYGPSVFVDKERDAALIVCVPNDLETKPVGEAWPPPGGFPHYVLSANNAERIYCIEKRRVVDVMAQLIDSATRERINEARHVGPKMQFGLKVVDADTLRPIYPVEVNCKHSSVIEPYDTTKTLSDGMLHWNIRLLFHSYKVRNKPRAFRFEIAPLASHAAATHLVARTPAFVVYSKMRLPARADAPAAAV